MSQPIIERPGLWTMQKYLSLLILAAQATEKSGIAKIEGFVL
jgi:hypothetical protein